MKKINLTFWMGLFLFSFLSSPTAAGPVPDLQQARPKVLFFSAIDIHYLRDSMRQWGEVVGANGFMLSYIADWCTPKDKLFEYNDVLRDVNLGGISFGIDSNFIKVALGYRLLPGWDDDKAWVNVINNFKNIARLIKESRTKGIALDTEPYGVALFDSKAERFKSIPRHVLKTKVYQRGKEIMEALTGVYPEMEIILLPEGAYYWFTRDGVRPNTYELWIDLFNGMASVRNKGGIIVASERTYSVVNTNTLIHFYNLINKTMEENVEDLSFWQNKCSIAIGMWPLGKSYSDKSARYSPYAFREQFLQSQALSPKYVWIYDEGTAWFQLKKNEVDRYTKKGRWIWEKDYQMLPTDGAIGEYYSVVKRVKRPK